jgi:hypothetical protein
MYKEGATMKERLTEIFAYSKETFANIFTKENLVRTFRESRG